MNKTIIPIKGMHCKACELLIGDKLMEIKNIKKVNVKFKDKSAEVYSNTPLDMELVTEAIREAGYEIGEDKPKTWFSRNPNDYTDLALAFLVLMVLFVLGSGFGLFNISVGGGNPSSLLVVLLIGLTAGVSTCMAMIGGLVLGISARHTEKHPEATAFQKFRPHLFFNLGRIMSYFILGGVIGLIGKVFQLSSPMLGTLTIIVGAVMLALGLKLIDIFPILSNASFTLPSGLSRLLGIKKHHEKEYSHLNSMLVGGLTFFLPCGFTQAMQLYAMSTGNFLSGALIMGVFAIGTAPGLLSIGGLTSIIKGSFAKMFFKFAGLIVIFLALFNISNGYNLIGWTLDFGSNTSTTGQSPNVVMENGVQVARMNQSFSGYSPNKFIVKKGIPVKWIIASQDSNSCSSGVSIPKLGVTKHLVLGENVIEFTPQETGKIKFTCTMGMYPGEFTVVDDTSSQPAAATSTSGNSPNISAKPAAPEPTGLQIIKTAYASGLTDINPKEFTVQSGKPVRFEVDVQQNGSGCMSTIMIPGFYEDPQYLEAGKTLTMDFTPDKKGTYPITCAMGVQRGTLNVI